MKPFFTTLITVTLLTTFSPFCLAHNDHHQPAINKVRGDLSMMVLGSGGPIANEKSDPTR
jgi:hypothetical protein